MNTIKGSSILVVDDQQSNLTLMTTMLSHEGYQVRAALNGVLALQSASKQLPDLILLDIMMPGMDGFEVCQQLKANDKTQDIPVIFLSSLSQTEDKVKAFAMGGVDYITKPFEQREVLARIETHLSLRFMQKQLQEKNLQLEQEITERLKAEQKLEKYHKDLEDLVAERTTELKQTNKQLRQEIVERRQVEQALRASEASYRRLAQQNQALLEQARHDAQTKTVLLNEVNHRVKNNLSAIIGLLFTEQQHVRPATSCQERLKRLISRIQGLAEAQAMLSNNEWQPLLLDQLAQQVCSVTLKLVSAKRVVVKVSGTGVYVTAEQAISLALVINELVNNSLEYALPVAREDDLLQIKIKVSQEKGDTPTEPESILLEFRDNGPGYPEAIVKGDAEQYKLGLYLVTNLIKHDLNGHLTLSNDHGAVTLARFKTQVQNLEADKSQGSD